MVSTEVFSDVFYYPDPDAQQRYAALVGVDEIKERLVGEAILLLDNQLVERWSHKHHGEAIRAVEELKGRPPLIILAGDVGTGKTELAETFTDAVARNMRVEGALYALSLSARGQGAVGQMTTLIGSAFSAVAEKARGGKTSKLMVMLIDEGDALAQSRESSQMHHEDRAGVNALIKGIDGLRKSNLPVLVLLCTNRLDALDPAIRRRAAFTISLHRPNELQRKSLLLELVGGTELTEDDLKHVVTLTGPTEDRQYGYTYSDLRQRLVPEAVMLAISRDVPFSSAVLEEAISRVAPTRPFNQEVS